MRDPDSQLAVLARRGMLRQRRVVEGARGVRLRVDGRELLAFCSNDYLGLAQHPALIAAAQAAAAEHGVGAGASALISGHHALHDALERRLAAFVGLPRALYFATGYMANMALLSAFARRGDCIYADELNHASLIDGARLSRAEVVDYPHADVAALARLLEAQPDGHKLVVTDAVFSMDGDLAPLREILALCERHDAWLVIDDAHGFGVLGEGGRGALAHCGLRAARVLYMATLGKAAGVQGAFVAGDAGAIEWLLQRGRTYIYTTAPPPMLAAATLASIDLIEQDEWRREHLRALTARLKEGAAPLPWTLLSSDTAIQPLVVGRNEAALSLMRRLEEQGIWVPAIRPPTVPSGTARLRISLSAAHTMTDVDQLLAALTLCGQVPSA